ncbi:hypothetical protein EV202_12532 [Bacteroides heparinolyticus]|uniref:Uncharacterized protein n=1 Tax=Prevotella heparinolytica TaxID=28113 RepID=A0A4R2LFJ1_9BACE|nr:hypothetical protein EV202_12532 [Bacteroides heparinolyticus]
MQIKNNYSGNPSLAREPYGWIHGRCLNGLLVFMIAALRFSGFTLV